MRFQVHLISAFQLVQILATTLILPRQHAINAIKHADIVDRLMIDLIAIYVILQQI
jgi:hypothetical protein